MLTRPTSSLTLTAGLARCRGARSMHTGRYQFMREVPESLETDLPTIDQIEAELRPDFPDTTA